MNENMKEKLEMVSVGAGIVGFACGLLYASALFLGINNITSDILGWIGVSLAPLCIVTGMIARSADGR